MKIDVYINSSLYELTDLHLSALYWYYKPIRMINEEFLHYLWKYKLYTQTNLVTTCGKQVEVLNPGETNTNAGADFFNAKIKIDNTIWAGNVEVHIKSSDWNLHQHQTDKAYNNVILHVVSNDDAEILNQEGKRIPTLVLNYADAILDEYLNLKAASSKIACEKHLQDISNFEISLWIQRMLIERLESKSKTIERTLQQTTNNWDEVFYRLLFRSFGFGINGDAFEQLAQSVPLSILLKYTNDISLVEALLYGQAGLLDGNFEEEYIKKLQQDYYFLKQKHQLKPLESHIWKFMRLRPSNFPTIRISQLANLLVSLKGVFGVLINELDIKLLNKRLQVSASSFWDTHYTFQKTSKSVKKQLGESSIYTIVINTIIPYLFTYGRISGSEKYEQKSLKWLSEMKPEKNSIINSWKANEIVAKSAGDSQALIYLFNNYCKPKKCLHCRIGHQVLAVKK